MDNKKLAEKILECSRCGFRKQTTKCEVCYDMRAVLLMAAAKEQQFNKILDEIYSRAAGCCASQDSIIRNTILEIKEKLYGKE